MIDREGRLLLTDFGLARVHATRTQGDRTHPPPPAAADLATEHGGTPGYIAPEVATGGSPTPAGDQYGLGVCLYEAVVGRKPPSPLIDAAALPRPAAARRDPGTRG